MQSQAFSIIEFSTENGERVYVETSSIDQGAYVPAGGDNNYIKNSPITIEKAISLITPIANGIIKTFNSMEQKPDECEVVFNVSFSNEFSIKILTLKNDANMAIKLIWKDKNHG